MKSIILSVALFLCMPILLSDDNSMTVSKTDSENREEIKLTKKKKLRHFVLFKFKEEASEEDIAKIEKAFVKLPEKIDEIIEFEWGINSSPENLNKGFTHGFLVTFESEEGRNRYLPHPAHKAFIEILDPFLEDVLVIDYLTN